jgi:hypothetical protein
MAGYNDTEITEAVSKFVQSNIRINRDALGPVDIDSKFSEVLRLFSSTLVYDPNAVFYIIYLATNKLNVDVELAIEYVEDLEEAITEMGYYAKDVTRTTLLGDAAAALLTVDQILTDKSVISSRAFTRYQQAVDEFIQASLEPNIKQSGEVVRTAQLARQASATTISNLSTAYSSILTKLSQIRSMLDEFNGLNLGVLSIQSSVQKVRDDLRTLQAQFESTATTRDDKIALCRAAYLSLASGKAVLNNFLSVTDPSEPRLLSSTSVAGRPAIAVGEDGEFTPASITGTRSAPWEVETGAADELKIAHDGEAEQTYTFIPPAQPNITASYRVSYDIVTGVNDLLEIDGLVVTLDPGTGLSAANVSADIEAKTSTAYTAAVVVVGGLDHVNITKNTPGATEIIMTADNGDPDIIRDTYATVGFYEGQSDSSTGLSAAEAVQQINEAGYISAEIVRTLYESGDADGEVIDTVTIELPEGSVADTDHAGDMLLIRSGLNAGYHRISSIVKVGGSPDSVTVESYTPFKTTGVGESWIILSENLKLTSLATDLTTALVVGDGTGNSLNDIMGFVDDTEVVGSTSGFRAKEDGLDLDFSQLDIVVGDVVRVVRTVGATTESTEHEVLELSSSNQQLELYPYLGTDWSIYSFRILSAAAVAYADFISYLDEWYSWLDTTEFSDDIFELERVMNPLLANKNPSIAQLNDARNTLLSLKHLLTYSLPYGLTEVLTEYWVALVPRIDAALKMLKERGLDRAYDLLMDGKIAEFFGMDKDDASSSAYMLKTMRSVVQSDLRVSKLDEDADDTILTDSLVGTDPDYDYSDADADENVKLLGEIPDFDSESDSSRTSRARY